MLLLLSFLLWHETKKKVGSPKKNCACRKAISREPLAFSDGLRLTWRLMGLSDRSDGDANAKRALFSRLLCHFPAIAGWEKRDWCYALLDGGARPSLPRLFHLTFE